jgi:hypothetical protein
VPARPQRLSPDLSLTDLTSASFFQNTRIRQLFDRINLARPARESILAVCKVLDPLFDLGLIERRKATEWPSITEHDFIRSGFGWFAAESSSLGLREARPLRAKKPRRGPRRGS